MPNRPKGPRLYFQRETEDRCASWIIRDGTTFKRTGCSLNELAKAEEALQAYIASKHVVVRYERHPSQIPIADVLNIYSQDVAPKHARPEETAARLERLGRFWGKRFLSAVNGRECRAYVEFVGKQQAARRDLEDFRAAIFHHRKEGLCSELIEVVLPEKAQPRERWLTNAEAARLLRAAWRGGQGKRKHVARFILVALYTGTRAGAICGAAMQPAIGRGYVDLEEGVFYRKAPEAKETKKRQPPIRIPAPLLAHIRRWRRLGVSSKAVVEFNGEPVDRVIKGFHGAAREAGLGDDVTPHTLRHTAATWAMQGGADLWKTAGYLGMTVQMLEERYGHHRQDHGTEIASAMRRRR